MPTTRAMASKASHTSEDKENETLLALRKKPVRRATTKTATTKTARNQEEHVSAPTPL